MGRGRGKGKKQTTISTWDDHRSGEEEKILASKKRGRPQKPLKDEIEEDELIEKTENIDENAGKVTTVKTSKDEIASENGTKRRKRSSQVKENSGLVKEENDSGGKSGTENSVKPVGFRQNGSRRKSKPRRAAEVGVECT